MSILNAFPFFKSAKSASGQFLSEDWASRSEILQENINLFCWRRPVKLEITRYLESILSTQLKAIQFQVNRETLHEKLNLARALWDKSEKLEGDIFWQDVERISSDFLKFSKDGSGVFHLKLVTNNACTKFHVDGYRLRLFSTYYGPGTEWLPEDAVNRQALGTTNECIIADPNRVQRMGTGHVGILKGELPGQLQSVKGIVHRSPEISLTSEKRIILRVDI
ncbi:MAG: DUF1826 domain-containing protein [Bacteroidota bacterium]